MIAGLTRGPKPDHEAVEGRINAPYKAPLIPNAHIARISTCETIGLSDKVMIFGGGMYDNIVPDTVKAQIEQRDAPKQIENKKAPQ
jgi:hypothetical protein